MALWLLQSLEAMALGFGFGAYRVQGFGLRISGVEFRA